MKQIFILILVFLSTHLSALNTNISGVVNSYAPVTALGANSVTIGAISPAHTFTCGDRVMVIQMKGASIATTNDASFGNISNINNAGNYEMATVSSVSGNIITFSENLSNVYTVSGVVQVVYVPQYEDATITATLTAQSWDGTIGGVIAIQIDGSLTMNADIDVSEQGFRGGDYHPSTQITGIREVCANFFGNRYEGNVGDDYRYDNANKRYAVEKGESISTHSTYLWGRGKLASAGGGGGIESGGGGGGANIGAGGNAGGGNPTSTSFFCTMRDVFGIGGSSLTTFSSGRLFLGGASGAGNNGNEQTAAANYFADPAQTIAAPGRNGGGIIYIDANTIIGNNNEISSNGEDGYTGNTTGNFGGGGGGAGGSIVLNVNQFMSNLDVNAEGGVGTSVRVVSGGTASRRRGAGGGGGGGSITFFNSSTPSGVTTSVVGGTGGLSYDQGGTLRPSHYGTAGGNGSVSFSYSEIGSNNEAVSLVSSTTSTSDVTNTTRRVDFSENGFLTSINSNGNDLGNVTINATIGSNGPFASTGCSTSEFYLPRYFDIVPTNQPSSACDVSLYITGTELANFISFTNAQSTAYKNCWGAVNSISDLMVTVVHSDGSKEALIPTISYITCSDIYKIDIQVSQFSTFYIHSNKGVLAGNLLPVEWLSFTADYVSKEEVSLNWSTATEINNDGFFIERSYDGENFEEITWVNGKGNYSGKTEYNYIDEIDVYSNYSNVYYRLNQLDYNGEQEYSKVIALKLKTYNFIGELYPNPTYDRAKIELINNEAKYCNISIINAIGKLVYSKKVTTTPKIKSQIDLDIENLNAGVYTCLIEINGEKEIRRLIKK